MTNIIAYLSTVSRIIETEIENLNIHGNDFKIRR